MWWRLGDGGGLWGVFYLFCNKVYLNHAGKEPVEQEYNRRNRYSGRQVS